MFSFSKAKDILGLNARNLQYVMRYNSLSQRKFSRDKIFSKHFLESRGISVAKLYHHVVNHRQLTSDFFSTLPPCFAVKPNQGSGGEGILVLEKKQKHSWVSPSGKKFDVQGLYRHSIEILDGKYSPAGIHDTILFEERLEPHPDFRHLSSVGLPDIRVIVFNLVPVMAMIRIPTYDSEGKANMELGAIGVGIDIGSGQTTFGAQNFSRIQKMPNGHRIKGFQIPFWDEILLTASQVQNFSGIGYLGIDLVVTKPGVKVLEINALSGTKIQIANKAPLKKRLEKIHDLKVMTSEEGVDIAKKLFSRKPSTDESLPLKPVLGMMESVILHTEKPHILKAKVDLMCDTNLVRTQFYQGAMLDITLQGKRLKIPVKKGVLKDCDLILSGKFLTDFYIDPAKKVEFLAPEVVTSQLDEKMMHSVDEKVCELDEKVHLLSFINPQNILEQKALFLENPEFSPQFLYRMCDTPFTHIRRELKKIPEVNHVMYPLFAKKIEELGIKLDLLQSIGSKAFGSVSAQLFGDVSEHTYRSALKFLKQNREYNRPEEGDLLDTNAAIKAIEQFLKRYKLSHWKIKFLSNAISDIQITKRHVILLKKGARFRANRLQAVLVHEIGTHIFRFENGKSQPFRIFERGTAGYLKTEEGLAIWNQNQLKLDLGYKFLKPAYFIVALYLGKKMGFCELFHFMKDTYDFSDNRAWKICVKVKRGLTDTSQKQVFTKDSLYFRGNQEIERFIEQGKDIKDLYVGKIRTGDLKVVQQIEGMKPAKFLL